MTTTVEIMAQGKALDLGRRGIVSILTKDHVGDVYERRDSHAADGAERMPESQEHLLALRTDHMEVSVSEEPHTGRIVLSLTETRMRRTYHVSLTPLELEVLAFGLSRVARQSQHESERR